MVQILHIRLQSPGTHESHITDVRWYNPDKGAINVATVAAMVKFISGNGRAYVCNGRRITDVEVVFGDSPYIRTHADDSITDNLLSLPRF